MLMPSLMDLHRAVAAALAAGHVGMPVFVRYLLLTPDEPQQAPARLAEITATVSSWIGQPLVGVYAPAPIRDGTATVTLRFDGGGTALVSVCPGDGAVDMLLLGHRGTLAHELARGAAYTLSPPRPDPQLLGLLARALRSTLPEAVP
jgi:hypothetical protein